MENHLPNCKLYNLFTDEDYEDILMSLRLCNKVANPGRRKVRLETLIKLFSKIYTHAKNPPLED